jgi:hypothetical protein
LWGGVGWHLTCGRDSTAVHRGFTHLTRTSLQGLTCAAGAQRLRVSKRRETRHRHSPLGKHVCVCQISKLKNTHKNAACPCEKCVLAQLPLPSPHARCMHGLATVRVMMGMGGHRKAEGWKSQGWGRVGRGGSFFSVVARIARFEVRTDSKHTTLACARAHAAREPLARQHGARGQCKGQDVSCKSEAWVSLVGAANTACEAVTERVCLEGRHKSRKLKSKKVAAPYPATRPCFG